MSTHDEMDLTPEQRRLQESLRSLGSEPADEKFRESLRARFISGEIAEGGTESDTEAESAPAAKVVPLPRRSRARRLFPAAVAIAAALAVIFLMRGDEAWRIREIRGAGTVAIGGRTLDAADPGAMQDLLVPSAQVVVGEGVQLDLVLDGVLVAGAVGPATFDLPPVAPKDTKRYEFAVLGGEFRVKTGPRFPGRKLIMTTTEGRVEITGTSVAVYKDADVTCVCVLEGTARIGRDSEHLDAIPAGMRKVMFANGDEPLIIPIEPGHEQSLIEFEKLNRDTFDDDR